MLKVISGIHKVKLHLTHNVFPYVLGVAQPDYQI